MATTRLDCLSRLVGATSSHQEFANYQVEPLLRHLVYSWRVSFTRANYVQRNVRVKRVQEIAETKPFPLNSVYGGCRFAPELGSAVFRNHVHGKVHVKTGVATIHSENHRGTGTSNVGLYRWANFRGKMLTQTRILD